MCVLQLCLTFTWKDAFDKGSLFGGSVKLGETHHTISYIQCTLNIHTTRDVSFSILNCETPHDYEKKYY